MENVKSQIVLSKEADKMLKMIKVEFDFENKSEAVEFIVEAFRGEFAPEIDEKFARAMTKKHAAISSKKAKSARELNREMDSW